MAPGSIGYASQYHRIYGGSIKIMGFHASMSTGTIRSASASELEDELRFVSIHSMTEAG